LQRETGHNAEARQSYQAAKDANPGSLAADLMLARVDVQEHQPDRARPRLEALVAADPKNMPALLLLADVEEHSGNPADAIKRYRAVLTMDTSNVQALNDLAYLLATQNPDEALAPAQKAVELAPDNAAVQDTLGFVFYRKGDYRQATNYIKAGVAKEPTPSRQFHLGMCYRKSGETQLAAKTLAAALQADPNLPKTEYGW
jgi:tetratricopeptide (TPR) repeat protein